jgi:hypothetical protein
MWYSRSIYHEGDKRMAESKFQLTFLTEGLPGFAVGIPQDFNIQASGGTPPYRFQITEGSLPASLKLSEDGRISGAVASQAPDTTVFVRVTDADGSHLTQAFDVQVPTP